MRNINEKDIAPLAPNANAVSNARKISSGGGFVSRMRSADDSFYMGECRGSGKSNYVVSADYVDEEHPVFRCSCPSRQFPCKHSLALLFEMAAGKEFEVGEIPKDILEKREKKEAREARKAAAAQGGKASADGDGGGAAAEGAGGEAGPAKGAGSDAGSGKSTKAAKGSRAGKAARTKKIKKQLEGLELLKQLTDQLMSSGLASMGSVSLKNYRDLAKQLGDYYLPGPQALLNRLILEMESYQQDQDRAHYHQSVEVLKKLRALERKASAYLMEKLETDSPGADDDILYEELGGIWKLDQLNELGLKKEQAQLLQLSFQVIYDEAKKEYTDLGYWVELGSGEISCTCNYRPVKALKYVKQEDTCFDVARVPVLSYYPGTINRRIRWESASFEPASREHFRLAKTHAHRDIAAAVKIAKNEIKNLLSDDFCAMMIAFERIGRMETENGTCLAAEDSAGNRLELRGRKGWEDTLASLPLIPDPDVLHHQVMFGLVYYDPADHMMCMYPCSIVTDRGIVRLLY